jgi:hypothetical protein
MPACTASDAPAVEAVSEKEIFGSCSHFCLPDDKSSALSRVLVCAP